MRIVGSFIAWLFKFFVVLVCFVFSISASLVQKAGCCASVKRLAGKIVSEMISKVSSWT